MRRKPLSTWLRALPLLALLSGLTCLAVSPFSAHALLQRASPTPNANLATSPPQVELLFSEPIEGRLSSISVLDGQGKAVDQGDVRVDASNPNCMTVSLLSLPDGVYTVSEL